jgi:hypothetical protein
MCRDPAGTAAKRSLATEGVLDFWSIVFIRGSHFLCSKLSLLGGQTERIVRENSAILIICGSRLDGVLDFLKKVQKAKTHFVRLGTRRH